MKDHLRKTILVAVLLAVLVISQVVSAAPSLEGELVYDNFEDNTIDPSLWSYRIKDSGPTASETSQRLEITVPANSSGSDFSAWYDSTCILHGDYDIQVDYQVLTWPNESGVRFGLTDQHANMHRISSGIKPGDYDIPGGLDYYMTLFNTGAAWSSSGVTPTSDAFGKLRLVRAGDKITSFYFDNLNNAWVLDASNSAPSYADDTPFALGAWSADSVFTDQDVKIAFDNMIINAGELICPTVPSSGLTITQVADQATVSTGDPMGFTITITNNGNTTAQIVQLTNPLPIYTQFDWSIGGADAAACLMTTDGVVSCNFQDIAPGAVKTIRLTAPEYEYYSKCLYPIISTATLMAYNQPVNKTATATITVLCPNIFIDPWTDTGNVPAGDPVNFTLTFGNLYGEGNAKDVDVFFDIQSAPGTSWEITDVIPDSAKSNCTFEPYTGTYETWMSLECFFDQIAPQEEIIIKFASPTTNESCGSFYAAGGIRASNTIGHKTKPLYIIVNCLGADTTPPAITPTITGILGQNGWYTSDVSLTWSVEDPESGVTGLTECRDQSITQDQAATVYLCEARSAGGTASQTVSIARDATAPIITCPALPQNSASGQTVTATVDAALSGLNGAASVLSRVFGSSWPQTLSFTAVDIAGNTATQACTFAPTYGFTGFIQPVDNPGPGPSYVFNSVKAGGAVPVSFSLAGDKGLNILAAGYPSSMPANCTTANVTDPIEQTVTAGNSSLSYNAVNGTYTYVWKTNKNWAGTCRVLNIKFNDGTQHLAYFQFK